MQYARVIDIHKWYTTLIDWGKVRDNFDLVGIRAGVGVNQDPYLKYYVTKCWEIGKPYFTYHIPAKAWYTGGYTVEQQAAIYMGWPGVRDAVRCADIEPPNGDPVTMVSASELLRYMPALGDKTIWYSNKACLDMIAWPAALANYYNWIASYYYVPGTTNYFKYFEEFLLVHHPEYKPVWLRNTIYDKKNIQWQITPKGDARYYLSIAPGPWEADLSLSTVDKETCLAIMRGGGVIEPPPQEIDFMATLRCDCPGSFQNVRRDHVVLNGNEVGIVEKGQDVKAVSVWSDPVTKGNIWVKITEPVEGWTALRYGGTTYLIGGGD